MKKVYDKPMVDIYSLRNADNTNVLGVSSNTNATNNTTGVFSTRTAGTNGWGQLK